MKLKRILRGGVALCMAAVLCMAVVLPGSAASVSDLQAKSDALQKQIDNYDKQLAKNANNAKNKQAYIDTLQAQIDTLNESVTVAKALRDEIQGKVDTLNTQIADTQKKIDAQQREIDKTYDQLKVRIRSMYMSGGNASTLEMLFGASDYSSFLLSMELVSRTSKHDSEMIRQLKTQVQAQEKSKAELDAQKAEQQAELVKKQETLDKLTAQEKELSAKANEAKSYIDSLNAESAEAQKRKNELEQQQDAYDAEIEKIINSSGGSSGSGSISGGSGSSSTPMLYPLPTMPLGGRGYISSPYGRRTDPYTGFHKGMDLTGSSAHGEPIAAALDGKVIVAGYGWNGGYGNYVIIDHGNGLSTLYGHCSSLATSVGARVSQGSTIAYVGNTGNSFGPHLHFEVRINGQHTNPYSYIIK